MRISKRNAVLAVGAVLWATAATAQPQDRAEVALRAAMEKETVDGNLKAAMEDYKKLAQNGNKSVAARALVRLGECYEKQGNAQARKTYEQVVSKFGDQPEAVAQARARLAALGKSGTSSELALRALGTRRFIWNPSRDGRFLVEDDGNGGVALRDLQTDETRAVAKAPCRWGVISPNDREIAVGCAINGTSELRIVRADGGGERTLWKTEKGAEVWDAQWFPDNSKLMAWVVPQEGTARLLSISVSDGSATTLWEGKKINDPQLSPDGKSIVFTRRVRENPAADELWQLALDSRKETLLFQQQAIVNFPLWTPDGSAIVFQSDRRAPGVTIDLWMLRVSDGKTQGFPVLAKTELGQIANGRWTAYARSPITRDGALYFFRHNMQGGRELMSVEFDPASGKAVGSPSFIGRKGGASFGPSFSRDGRLLAYISGEPGSPQSMVIQSVDSGEERSVPDMPAGAKLSWAVISPDGRSLLIDARLPPRNELEIYRVDVAGGAWTSVTKAREGEPTIIPYSISPDGKTAYVLREQTRRGAAPIYRLTALNLDTLEERELVSVGWNGAVAVSPDGKLLAVASVDGKETVIHLLPIEGGPQREVYRGAGIQRSVTTWTPDGRYLILAPLDPSAAPKEDYLRVPADGGAAQPVGIQILKDSPVQFRPGLGGARVSPDGRRLVFTVRGDSSANAWWVLENFLPGVRASAK